MIASGLTAPHQIWLDDAHNQAFVVEFNGATPAAGRLVRIDLSSHAQAVVAMGLDHAVGLVMTQDLQFAYVSEQTTGPDGGRVVRIRLSNGHREVIAKGLTAPFFLTWTDPGESGILVAERDPANRVTRVDLAATPITRQVILSGVPFRPSSVEVVTPTDLLVCSDQAISRYQLTSSVYRPTGPVLLGIGHVPVDRITGGYADTTGDPGYFFQVKDAPFGGSLALMFNHERAYADGARFYRLMVDGTEVKQAWTDYRWSTSTNRFESEMVAPSAAGYYRVRAPSELWYNHWLGYMLNTVAPVLPNGPHTLSFRLFGAESLVSEMGSAGDAGRSVQVLIDNTAPFVAIEKILHGAANGPEVGTCGIVDSGTDQFSFRITANEAQQHLRGWSLGVVWGDNKSASIASDSYAAHVSPTRKWAGVSGTVVPGAPWHAAVPGDFTSTHCAHTFTVSASSRTIDGWSYLYWASSTRSITLMLP